MDFIVKLGKSNGFDAIMGVVEKLSKHGHFIPFKHPYSASMMAENFMKEVVRLHLLLLPLSVIVILCLLVYFGRNCLNCKGQYLK